MTTKQLWFEPTEFEKRLATVQGLIRANGLDGLLVFSPETVTWLTGFFTAGHGYFELAVVPPEGAPTILCRDVSAYYAETTCAFDRLAYWSDGEDKLAVIRKVVDGALGGAGRLGADLGSWPVNVALFREIAASLEPATLEDVGGELQRLRLVKSPAEIDYQRRAAHAAEAGMAAGLAAARPGASERQVAAAVSTAMILAGSDTPGPGILSSGERALHLHGRFTDRVLEPGDTVQLETCPHVRHYHARFMRTIKVGRASAADRELATRLIELQDRALEAVAPGVPATVPDRRYRDAILATGVAQRYTNKTFYSVGLIMEPNGGEPLEATPHATWSFEVGQVFHTYLLVGGFGFSETITIVPGGYERLTNFPRELLVSEG